MAKGLKGVLGVASAIALLSLVSKGFGFGRELVIAASFGAGIAKDAYTAAYVIPAFSLVMLGGLTGPFHTVTQKIITTLRSRGQDDDVPAVVATILVAVTAVLGALSVLAYFGAPALVHLVASQARPEVFALAVAQLQVMSPLVLLGGLIGILCGISNDRGDFTLPSLSPLVASIAVIAVVLFRADGMALAWGTMLGGIGQFLLQAPAAAKLLRSGPQVSLRFSHPEVRALWPLLLPASIASTIGTLNVIIGTNFASSLPQGAMSVFDYANKLIQLPLGILMTALLIPVFPLLTQAAVQNDRAGLFRWINQGLSAIALATVPLIALFIAAGTPLVGVMYERGAFSPETTATTAQVLALCGLGIFTYGARDLFIRAFYALDDSRTPLFVSLLSMGVTTAAMACVIGPFGLLGLAGATSAVTVFNCLLVGFLLRRKLGALPLGPALATLGQATAASVAAGLASAWAGSWLPALPGLPGFFGHAAHLALQGAVLAGVYVAGLAVFGFPVQAHARQLLGRFRRKAAPAAVEEAASV